VDEWGDEAGGQAAYTRWAMAERRPLIRPAATFSPAGEKGRFFGFGATDISRLRRLGGVLARGVLRPARTEGLRVF